MQMFFESPFSSCPILIVRRLLNKYDIFVRITMRKFIVKNSAIHVRKSGRKKTLSYQFRVWEKMRYNTHVFYRFRHFHTNVWMWERLHGSLQRVSVKSAFAHRRQFPGRRGPSTVILTIYAMRKDGKGKKIVLNRRPESRLLWYRNVPDTAVWCIIIILLCFARAA